MDLKGVKMCFGCGEANPIGLKLKLNVEGEKATATFIPRDVHQSYAGIVHGGIMAALLDEAAGRLLYDLGWDAVTAQIEVTFKKPARIGKKILISAEVQDKRGKLVHTFSRATTPGGELLAEARATFFRA